MGRERQVGEITVSHKEAFGGDEYAYYLDCRLIS